MMTLNISQVNSSSSSYIITGGMMESCHVGGREVSVGHFSEDECFPAKAPNAKARHHDRKILLDMDMIDKGQVQQMEQDHGPVTVGNLNIMTRHQVCSNAVVGIVDTRDITTSDVFNDVQEKESICMGKVGIQEESSNSLDTYKSQFVVSGTRLAVTKLLAVTDQLVSDIHGVLVDINLRPSYGRYEEGREFDIIKMLGKGGFGEVDLCQHKSGKRYVTKKIFGKFKKKEVQVLMSLTHQNITSFLGYINRNGTHEILMEYGGMSLKAFVETEKKRQAVWRHEVVMRLAMQGFSALLYMHSFGILHLDVKPENICIDYDSECRPVIKLTDFGTSKTPEQAITHDGWTPEYMSPEACQSIMVSQTPELAARFQRFELTGKADVYAFGLTVYFMLEGSHAVIDIWRKQITPETFARFRPTFIVSLAQFPNYVREHVVRTDRPEKVNMLLSQVLAGDPDCRLTAEEAHQYIQDEVLMDGVVDLPTIFPPDSPSSQSVDMSDDLMMSQTTFDTATATDISLRKSRPVGGGKDIKNHLRQKILRRKSAGPYQRQDSLRMTSKPEKSEVEEVDCSLPVFAALLDD